LIRQFDECLPLLDGPERSPVQLGRVVRDPVHLLDVDRHSGAIWIWLYSHDRTIDPPDLDADPSACVGVCVLRSAAVRSVAHAIRGLHDFWGVVWP
jgi:hypothetical protein